MEDPERLVELARVEEARRKYNLELNKQWRQVTREADTIEHRRRSEEIREGREHEHEEHEEKFEHKVLAALQAINVTMRQVLEKLGGGARLAFRLILKQGDTMQISIISMQRVGGMVGVVTSMPHGLVAGDGFAIDGASDPTLNSAQGAATVGAQGLDATHFTFTQAGPDTAVVSGGTLTTAAASGGSGTGVVGTPSVFGLTVVDQTGATQPLPAGVTPSVSVDGGATASLSADNATVTVNYTAPGTYTVTVSDASGKVASASASVTVTAGGPKQTLSFKLTQQS